jgi:uncharacterized heparinase superfamily protein
MTDPWSGNPDTGKDIINGTMRDSEFTVNLSEIFTKKYHPGVNYVKYVFCFAWIRDLQAVGGNNSMKFTRDLILMFIDNYRGTRKFWLDTDGWAIFVTAERIINLIFSYSFFASGSNDSVQKKILSSLSEQYSHLWRCYTSELNSLAKIAALKAIFICLCSMRSIQSTKIKKIIKEICCVAEEEFDKSGMLMNYNPVDHFNVFRNFIEIRFMAKNIGIDLPKRIFSDLLSEMASCVRFFRLGDGMISNQIGDKDDKELTITPSRQLIDTALSVVESKKSGEKTITGFMRLSTKRMVIIVNTLPRHVKSHFNPPSEPGLNIFDFEASFGVRRPIKLSDVSVLSNGMRVKIGKHSKYFADRNIENNKLLFTGEVIQKNHYFDFTFKRKIEIHLNQEKVSGTDTVYMSGSFYIFSRFILDRNVTLKKIHTRCILVTIDNCEYIFSIAPDNKDCEIFITDESWPFYPMIEICRAANHNNQISWSIET